MSGSVSRRERGPWKPGRGQYVRIWGTSLAVPERVAFAVAMAVCVALLIIALVLF
ncbi:MAG TPA: hypothetical protein VMK84_25075 [Streptosporangiaceae bacterium]|nr:hypothetical protein [Streptosporangiaceae bacterium]